MMKGFPLASDTWANEEYEAIERVANSKRFSLGEEVYSFEKEFAQYFGSQYAVMVNSGSSANLIAVAALVLSPKYNLNRGDEVLVPAVSWATTYTVLHQYGLKLRFIDIDSETLNIDVNLLESAITPKTRAIFAVNLLGNPNDFDKICEVCKKYELILLEDNCESMGAMYKKKYTGTFGVIGTFSTFYSHHMATMEGGMIVTDDCEIADMMRSLRSHGWTRGLKEDSSLYSVKQDLFYESFNFILPGYNVRPIEMEAAIGREQLKKLNGFLKYRRINGKYFENEILNLDGVKTQKNIGESSYFGFPLIFESNAIRNKVVHLFDENDVECRPIVAGNFTRNRVIDFFDYSTYNNLTQADQIHEGGLFIGNHHYDCREKMEFIIKILMKYIF